jgi:DNA-binding transcriptional regulator YiaG
MKHTTSHATYSPGRMRAAISELHAAFGDTQRTFAERTGVSAAAVLRWENGERLPSARSLWVMWHLAQQKNNARLMQIFAEAFYSLEPGYPLEEQAS